jgi:hypothetical protein
VHDDAAVLRRVVHPFGARVELAADDRRVLDAAGASLARHPRRAGAAPGRTFRVRATTGADEPGDPAWPATTVRYADGVLTLRCGSGRLVADVAAERAELTMPPALLAVPDAVRMAVEGAVHTLLINGGHLHALHAGLVTLAGRGLLLRGPSGAGKSTLTYACLRAGGAVASDDWVYAVPGADPGALWGYPWRMFLVAEALGHFPELADRPCVLHPGADRLKVPIEPPVGRRRIGARVDAVVLLDPDPRLDLRPASATEAAERFAASALPTERDGLPPAFVAALLDRPCFVLQRGTDPNAAAMRLRELACTGW